MVDAYQAVRQLERLFGYKGPDYRPTPQTSYKGEPKGQLIATIVYNPVEQTIRVERTSGLEQKAEK